jgi:hypothetical protein
MGNYILGGGGPVRIDRRHHDAALQALRAAHDALGEWVRGDLAEATDLASALEALIWTPTLDGDGNIVALELAFDVKDTWLRTWERVFDAIAPFVTPGSHLRILDENYGEPIDRLWKFDGAGWW